MENFLPLTDAEEDRSETLADNPGLEQGLWRSWVVTVCGWEKIQTPTASEWQALSENWYPGKAPIESVAELKAARQTN